MEDGLRQSSILALYQDSNGFIWIGTEDGLHKYDGYEFKIFIHQPGEHGEQQSISNNSVNCIEQDSFGNLWIGTDFGLNLLDLKTETFRQVPLPDSTSGKDSLFRIRQLLFNPIDSILWVGSDKGLDKLKLTGHLNDPLFTERQLFIKDTTVLRLYLDSDKDLWIGTHHGAGMMNRETPNVNFPYIKKNKPAFDIKEDSKKNIWVSSGTGIEFFHKDSNGLKCHTNKPKWGLLAPMTTTICLYAGIIQEIYGRELHPD